MRQGSTGSRPMFAPSSTPLSAGEQHFSARWQAAQERNRKVALCTSMTLALGGSCILLLVNVFPLLLT